MKGIIKANSGWTSLAVIATMVIMGAMGLGIAQLMTTSQEMRLRQILYQKAYYINQAGLEYAVRRVWEGVDSDVPAPGINFAGGTFTSVRSESVITVTSQLAEAQVIHQLISPTQADCLEIDTSNVEVGGGNDDWIQGIRLRKTCLTSITIDAIVASWTPDNGEEMNEVRIQSSTWPIFPATLSGVTTDLIPDYQISTTGVHVINRLHFHPYEMEEKYMSIDFIMGDGTIRNVQFEADD